MPPAPARRRASGASSASAAGTRRGRGPRHFLAAGLTALAGGACIEVPLRAAKCVQPGIRYRTIWRSRPVLRLRLRTILHLRGWAILGLDVRAALQALAATKVVDARIGGIDIAVQDLVIYGRSVIALQAVVQTLVGGLKIIPPNHVVVRHVFVDIVVVIDVGHVHGAIDDGAIYVDVRVAVVDINVGDMDVGTAALHPATVPATPGPPTSVEDAAPAAAKTPVEIKIEPRTDGKACAEGNSGSPDRAPVKADRKSVV